MDEVIQPRTRDIFHIKTLGSILIDTADDEDCKPNYIYLFKYVWFVDLVTHLFIHSFNQSFFTNSKWLQWWRIRFGLQWEFHSTWCTIDHFRRGHSSHWIDYSISCKIAQQAALFTLLVVVNDSDCCRYVQKQIFMRQLSFLTNWYSFTYNEMMMRTHSKHPLWSSEILRKNLIDATYFC